MHPTSARRRATVHGRELYAARATRPTASTGTHNGQPRQLLR